MTQPQQPQPNNDNSNSNSWNQRAHANHTRNDWTQDGWGAPPNSNNSWGAQMNNPTQPNTNSWGTNNNNPAQNNQTTNQPNQPHSTSWLPKHRNTNNKTRFRTHKQHLKTKPPPEDTNQTAKDILDQMFKVKTPNQRTQSTKDKCQHCHDTLLTWNVREDINRFKANCKLYQPIDGQPQHTAVHDLCDNPEAVPPELIHTLGLGLGFRLSLKREHPKQCMPDTERFKRDIRIKTAMQTAPPNPNHNPKPHMKSDWDPDPLTEDVDLAMESFETELKNPFRTSLKQKHQHDIPPKYMTLLRQTKRNRKWTITNTDKKLGPAMMETKKLHTLAHANHLSDTNNYTPMSKELAEQLHLTTFYGACEPMIDEPTDDASHDYFTNALIGSPAKRDRHGRVCPLPHLTPPYFHILPKAHKKYPPPKTRPVASSVSTPLEPLSKWVDHHLQQVLHLCPAYLKDSWQLLHKLKNLPKLHKHTCICTVDAVSMCSNMPTKHGIQIIEKWFFLHKNELPDKCPTKRIIDALHIIMNFNVFTCGNQHFMQIDGTAMGTPCACACATMYYSYHEETKLLHTCQSPKPILYARLIDDALVIVKDQRNNFIDFINKMKSFKDNNNNGLDWEHTQPATTANFLDLAITILPNGSISTKTHQKPVNLYLCSPPTSAQPHNALKGMIYGTLHRYLWQNTDPNDFLHMTTKFIRDLKRRGHQTTKLIKLALNACNKLKNTTMPGNAENFPPQYKNLDKDPNTNSYLHPQHHPQNPPLKDIQCLFTTLCLPTFQDNNIPVTKMTVACSAAPSIENTVKKNRMDPDTDTSPTD